MAPVTRDPLPAPVASLTGGLGAARAAQRILRRYRAWYLGEAWAVVDHSARPKVIVVGDRDYASARSAARAAARLNAKEGGGDV